MTAPTITTDRLVLAPHAAADLDALAAIWADPVVCRHIGGRTRPREEVWLRLLRHVGQWTLLGHGMWVLRDRATGTVLGEAGLLEARRDTDPALPDRPETGWTLATAAHGRGLAREAMAAVLGWADGRGIAATMCIVDPANASSLRLAERIGYRPAGEILYGGRPARMLMRG